MDKFKSQDGFSMVELLIVVLIIGILLSFAIPTYRGIINRAKNTVAQATLRNAVQAATTLKLYSEYSSWQGIGNKELSSEEYSLLTPPPTTDTSTGVYKAGRTANPNMVFIGNPTAIGGQPDTTINQGNNEGIILCVASQADNVYCARQTYDTDTNTYTPWTYTTSSSINNALASTTEEE